MFYSPSVLVLSKGVASLSLPAWGDPKNKSLGGSVGQPTQQFAKILSATPNKEIILKIPDRISSHERRGLILGWFQNYPPLPAFQWNLGAKLF
jgi:hypothetical protein